MAEIAPVTLEQTDRRRVVHVDIVVVRENKLNIPQGILGARPLTDARFTALHGRQLLFAHHRHHLARAHHDLETLPVKISGIPSQLGHRLTTRNRGRHIPVGAELDHPHLLVKHWRLGIERLADNHVHLQRNLHLRPINLEAAQLELRQINHQHALIDHQRRPAQALHSQNNLLDAGGGRHIQLLEGTLTDHAIRR